MVYQLFNLIFSWFALANYYIAFAILSESMKDKSFNLKGIGTVNVILNYFHLGLLVMVETYNTIFYKGHPDRSQFK